LDADGLFERIGAAGVEHVAFCHDPAAGLRALVVIGSTKWVCFGLLRFLSMG